MPVLTLSVAAAFAAQSLAPAADSISNFLRQQASAHSAAASGAQWCRAGSPGGPVSPAEESAAIDTMGELLARATGINSA
jgi:hypothetical protein